MKLIFFPGALLAIGLFQAMPSSLMAGTYSTPNDTSIAYFGYPNTATYGQTFTAPGGTLDSVSFQLENTSSTWVGSEEPTNFTFDVMAWDSTSFSGTGSILYTSAVQTVADGADSFQTYTADPDLNLTAGDTYVVFINESGLNSVDSAVDMGGTLSASPLGGQFVYLNNGDDLSELTSSNWQSWSVAQTSYTMVFGPASAPDETSTMLLMAASVLGFAVMGARKRAAVLR